MRYSSAPVAVLGVWSVREALQRAGGGDCWKLGVRVGVQGHNAGLHHRHQRSETELGPAQRAAPDRTCQDTGTAQNLPVLRQYPLHSNRNGVWPPAKGARGWRPCGAGGQSLAFAINRAISLASLDVGNSVLRRSACSCTKSDAFSLSSFRTASNKLAADSAPVSKYRCR